MSECVHHYDYVGVVYQIGFPRAGSSARDVHYFDRYTCRKCLDSRLKRLEITTDSYQEIRFAARPIESGETP